MHHVLEKDHWVSSSVTGGQVLLYDAEIYSYQPLIYTGRDAGCYYCACAAAGLGVDCGAFAIANAFTVANDRNSRHTSCAATTPGEEL